ncbi:hypothetical protein J7L02_02055 [Candidatus Woesearchaeota archaeon]|nr:hypothetical protein [Candidatus Woesearchaeota archaeon]
MRNKKAAISLGVNAIVILIIAVIMLGMILAFLKGTFSNLTEDLESKIKEEPTPAPATSSSPISLSREYLTIKQGDPEVIKASVFNPLNATHLISLNISCNNILTLEVTPKIIPSLQRAEFITILRAKAVPPDVYLCSFISVYNNSGAWTQIATKDFTVKVK